MFRYKVHQIPCFTFNITSFFLSYSLDHHHLDYFPHKFYPRYCNSGKSVAPPAGRHYIFN